jgi:hypothetical protein
MASGGTALFDALAISGTRAEVRAGRGGDASARGRVSADGARGPICGGREVSGCAQNGGVVWMSDAAVTFKGVTISNTFAVRARPWCPQVPRCTLQNSCVTLHVYARRWEPRGGVTKWCW